jgi:hypothetical protein
MKTLGQAEEHSLRRAKGVQRDIVMSGLSHADYREMYEKIHSYYDDNDNSDREGPSLVKRQRRFVSLRHQVYTVESKKVALRCRDNKRQWVEPNKSLPFGHYKLS